MVLSCIYDILKFDNGEIIKYMKTISNNWDHNYAENYLPRRQAGAELTLKQYEKNHF